jgi:hypothetical protein
MVLINSPEKLARFRNHWNGKKMLELLRQHNGRLRVDLAVGVGKSCNIDRVIEEAIVSDHYDLVIALFPTRRIIEERRWVRTPPKGIKVVNLKPRPDSNCGEALSRRWEVFEKNGLGAWGRIELCGQCPYKSKCFWWRQFGEYLKGSRVIFGAQAHLERSPDFLNLIARWSEAGKILVILDEANFIMKPFKRWIKKTHLTVFIDVLERLPVSEYQNRWVYLCNLLLKAPNEDLGSYDWQMPWVDPDWSVDIQSLGYDIHGDSFHFLVYDLVHFCGSPIESRERAVNGDLEFAVVPNITDDFIIYSGTAHQKLSEYRLGKDFASPFETYSFNHPGTTWFNIASRLGVKMYFKKNSVQILDFFATLVAKRIREGKRPLLLAKKYFKVFCARQMEERLQKLGIDVQVVIDDWQEDLLKNDNIVPLIHFGMIGTNLFQEFDCAYCLTGFYVDEEAIDGILQDLLGSDRKIPLSISIEGRPLRRRAGVLNKKDRFYDLNALSQLALDQQEMGTVLQAVGRVRPYTKPREVITFQCADHPDLKYTKEFNNISEARNYFNIPNKRSANKTKFCQKVQEAKAKGMKQREVAEELKVSVRTIKRYWNIKGDTNPY